MNAATAAVPATNASAPGREVVVVYNTRVPESRQVAEYYAQRRQVPPDQVFGLDLPTSEGMTRPDYLDQLQRPLLRKLEAGRLFIFSPATNAVTSGPLKGTRFRVLDQSRIRYVALCYGVPLKILKDTALEEQAPASLPPELRRDEAAVDTQLALLPVAEQNLPWIGPLANPFYGATNAAMLHPTNSILLVTRLDGPSPAVARGLVDKAIEAETNGWWGRAYFDARGLATNDSYRLGDDFIRGAAGVARRYGFETELDEQPATFSVGHPMSQVALYAGWYDQVISGPFTLPKVEFMPGAFAYHLYSFSARTVRAPTSWVGTLLQLGATCTMGAVDEPYLQGTPDIGMFVSRFTFLGFTFAEAAYSSLGSLSWQTTLIGDPLYRPCGNNLESIHHDLERRGSQLVEWSHLLVVNRNASIGSPPADLIHYLEQQPILRQSAVLTEKLADLYWAKGALGDSVDTCETALRRSPTPQQRIRLLFTCAERRNIYGPDAKAYAHYETLLKENPDFPDALKVFQAMLPIAKRMNHAAEIGRCEKEIAARSKPEAK